MQKILEIHIDERGDFQFDKLIEKLETGWKVISSENILSKYGSKTTYTSKLVYIIEKE